METTAKTRITVETVVNAHTEKVWDLWTEPKHIIHWNFASIDWHTTYAEIDLRVGGRFLYRMEARDGSSGFDLAGTFNSLELYKFIEYTLTDGRRVRVNFDRKGTGTRVAEIFETELVNLPSRQREGWQAILDNFKRYAESPFPERMMKFEIEIDSDTDSVYQNMISEKSYRIWTSVFNSNSGFTGSWKKGSKILFTGTDENGEVNGMVSMIKENIPGKFISIEHMGILKRGIEITCGPEVDDWQGALESYTFTPMASKTIVTVDVDTDPSWQEYFGQKWPEALAKLKKICEK
jgi:uncharacterized protein YndB with AHSA1/START domain